MIENIAEGRRKEIADEFDRELAAGQTTDEAVEKLSIKYGITKENLKQLIREQRDRPDDDPDGGGPTQAA